MQSLLNIVNKYVIKNLNETFNDIPSCFYLLKQTYELFYCALFL